MTAFRNFTALAVASRACGFPPASITAGEPAPLTFFEKKVSKETFKKEFFIIAERKHMMRNRDISIPFRVTKSEQDAIDKKANKAKLNRTEYLIACALGKEITLVEDLKPILAELKRVGNNLNQLTKLANMGKITEVNLYETWTSLDKIYDEIFRLARRKDGDDLWQSS